LKFSVSHASFPAAKRSIKGLFEATTFLHDEVHASVKAEKMKIFWLCSKTKFLFSVPYLNLMPMK